LLKLNDASSLLLATRDRFSFPTGRSGFRQKAALILFPEAMRHLPTAATTAGGPSAIPERGLSQAAARPQTNIA
jgi:hypothetical protein